MTGLAQREFSGFGPYFRTELVCEAGEHLCPGDRDSALETTSAIEENIGFVERAVARIGGGQGGAAALRELRAFLDEIARSVERDPGLDIAVSDLCDAAAVIVAECGLAGSRTDARRSRLLKEAMQRLKTRVLCARPRAGADRANPH